jgi:ribosomal protein L10
MVWGAQDFPTLAKQIVALDKSEEFAAFQARGGVMDGERLTAERVKEISKWPNREEQLSLLLGRILSPGAKLASQLIGPGGALASQIEQKAKDSNESNTSES